MSSRGTGRPISQSHTYGMSAIKPHPGPRVSRSYEGPESTRQQGKERERWRRWTTARHKRGVTEIRAQGQRDDVEVLRAPRPLPRHPWPQDPAAALLTRRLKEPSSGRMSRTAWRRLHRRALPGRGAPRAVRSQPPPEPAEAEPPEVQPELGCGRSRVLCSVRSATRTPDGASRAFSASASCWSPPNGSASPSRPPAVWSPKARVRALSLRAQDLCPQMTHRAAHPRPGRRPRPRHRSSDRPRAYPLRPRHLSARHTSQPHQAGQPHSCHRDLGASSLPTPCRAAPKGARPQPARGGGWDSGWGAFPGR